MLSSNDDINSLTGDQLPLTTTKDEHVQDILNVMLQQEATTYARRDYLHMPLLPEVAGNVHPRDILDAAWRQRIMEWMFGVVDTCGLRRDSVSVAAGILDLCLSRGIVIHSRPDFQLAALTALQLSIKLFDSTVLKLESMVKLGRGMFSEDEVIDMEVQLLTALKWKVHPPTAVCFLRQFLRMLPADVGTLTRYVLGEVARFVAEISVCMYQFSVYPASQVTYGGILLAMDQLDHVALPGHQRKAILSMLERVTGKSPSSMSRLLDELHTSLDSNVSLQDLLQSIDAQFHHLRASNSSKMVAPSSPNSCLKPLHAPEQIDSSLVQKEVASPRDVVLSTLTNQSAAVTMSS